MYSKQVENYSSILNENLYFYFFYVLLIFVEKLGEEQKKSLALLPLIFLYEICHSN